jgi:hypothetical protein
MSGKPRPKGNAAWRRLSDEIPDDVVARHVEALGIIREALDGGVIDVQYVAASLRVLSGDYPCPHCLERPVAPRDTRAGLSGICEVCHKRRQRDGHLQRLAEIEVTREVNVGKTAVKRSRIAAGIPLPRSKGPTPEPVDEEETLIAGPHAAWQIDHAVRRQFRVSGQDVSVQRGRNSADSPAVSVVEEHLDTLFGECFAEGGIGFPIGGEDVTPNDRRSARVDNLQRPTGLCRDANDVDGQRHAVLDNVPAKGRFYQFGVRSGLHGCMLLESGSSYNILGSQC